MDARKGKQKSRHFPTTQWGSPGEICGGKMGSRTETTKKNKDDELVAFLLPKEQEAQREGKENPDAFPHLP